MIYNGYTEASAVPPSWHGWLHHTVDVPPTQETYKPRAVAEAAPPQYDRHAGAYRPPGSTLAAGRRPKATGDYKAWSRGQSIRGRASPMPIRRPFRRRIPRVNRARLGDGESGYGLQAEHPGSWRDRRSPTCWLVWPR